MAFEVFVKAIFSPRRAGNLILEVCSGSFPSHLTGLWSDISTTFVDVPSWNFSRRRLATIPGEILSMWPLVHAFYPSEEVSYPTETYFALTLFPLPCPLTLCRGATKAVRKFLFVPRANAESYRMGNWIFPFESGISRGKPREISKFLNQNQDLQESRILRYVKRRIPSCFGI